LKTDSVVLV